MLESKSTRRQIKNAAITLGAEGGLVGGPVRARRLSPSEKKKIASMGGKAKASKQKRKKR